MAEEKKRAVPKESGPSQKGAVPKSGPIPPRSGAGPRAVPKGIKPQGSPIRKADPQGGRSTKKPAGTLLSPAEKARLLQEKLRRREEEERAAEEIRLQKAQRKHHRRTLFLSAFLFSLCLVLLYVGFVAARIAFRSDGSEDALPLLLYRQGEREKDRRFEVEEIYRNGTYYLPVSVLEPYFAVTEFGDHRTRSVMITENGQWATFTLGTPSVVINGIPTSLRSDSFVENDELYLPMEFYTEKLNCFTLSHSVPLAANVLTFSTEKKPSFFLQDSPAPTPLKKIS